MKEPSSPKLHIKERLCAKLVELYSIVALLSCSIVLMEKTLSYCLVNLLDCCLVCFSGCSLITGSECCFILLHRSLERALEHFVLKSLCFDNLYALLCGFNVRQTVHLLQNSSALGFDCNGFRLMQPGPLLLKQHFSVYDTTFFSKYQEFFENLSKKLYFNS